MNESMEMEITPAWNIIPNKCTMKDFNELVKHLLSEVKEIEEAVARYEADPNGKNMAYIGEELADTATMIGTCFAAIESMDVVPCEDFTESCLAWVRHKNHSRGYHNRLSQREVEWR